MEPSTIFKIVPGFCLSSTHSLCFRTQKIMALHNLLKLLAIFLSPYSPFQSLLSHPFTQACFLGPSGLQYVLCVSNSPSTFPHYASEFQLFLIVSMSIFFVRIFLNTSPMLSYLNLAPPSTFSSSLSRSSAVFLSINLPHEYQNFLVLFPHYVHQKKLDPFKKNAKFLKVDIKSSVNKK